MTTCTFRITFKHACVWGFVRDFSWKAAFNKIVGYECQILATCMLWDYMSWMVSSPPQITSQNDSKSTTNVTSIDDMQRFVENYPEFRLKSGHVSKHVTLLSVLNRLIDKRRLMTASMHEQVGPIYMLFQDFLSWMWFSSTSQYMLLTFVYVWESLVHLYQWCFTTCFVNDSLLALLSVEQTSYNDRVEHKARESMRLHPAWWWILFQDLACSSNITGHHQEILTMINDPEVRIFLFRRWCRVFYLSHAPLSKYHTWLSLNNTFQGSVIKILVVWLCPTVNGGSPSPFVLSLF